MNSFFIRPVKMQFQCFLIVLISICLSACQSAEKKMPREGYIQVKGGRVWYRIVGEGKNTPLLLLHGGPGVPSYYLNPLAALGKDRPVIFIDQLGCGRSDRITDTAFMTVENFVPQTPAQEKIKLFIELKSCHQNFLTQI